MDKLYIISNKNCGYILSTLRRHRDQVETNKTYDDTIVPCYLVPVDEYDEVQKCWLDLQSLENVVCLDDKMVMLSNGGSHKAIDTITIGKMIEELNTLRSENYENCRLLGISGSVEAKLLAKIDRLEKELSIAYWSLEDD